MSDEEYACTRCHIPIDWGDYGPPEGADADERICPDCAWEELRMLRTSNADERARVVAAIAAWCGQYRGMSGSADDIVEQIISDIEAGEWDDQKDQTASK